LSLDRHTTECDGDCSELSGPRSADRATNSASRCRGITIPRINRCKCLAQWNRAATGAASSSTPADGYTPGW